MGRTDRMCGRREEKRKEVAMCVREVKERGERSERSEKSTTGLDSSLVLQFIRSSHCHWRTAKLRNQSFATATNIESVLANGERAHLRKV